MNTVGNRAFYGCRKLKRVNLNGSSIEKIGALAFAKCTALQALSLPRSLQSIGKQAFFGCKALKTIVINSSRLTEKKVGAKAFSGIAKKAKVTVPGGKKAEYKKLMVKMGAAKSIAIKEK